MKTGFRIPIALKLIAFTVALLAVTSLAVTLVSADLFGTISLDREKQANRDESRARASEIEGLLTGYIDRAKIVASLLLKDTSSDEEKQKSIDLTFRRDREFVAVEVVARGNTGNGLRVVNESYLEQYKLDRSFIEILRSAQRSRKIINLEALFAGKDGYIEVRNSTIEGGAPLLTVGFPLAKDDYGVVTHVVLAEFRLDRLLKAFRGLKTRTLYVVDSQGRLLAHPEEQRVLKGENLTERPVVRDALAAIFKSGEKEFRDNMTAELITAAYTRTSLGVVALAEVKNATILEAAKRVKQEAFHVAGQILSLALFLMFVFSITLTSPIEALAELTNQVAKGNFGVKARVRSKDEVGQLGEAFNQMIEGLVERDKVKNMFSKFHGSSVAEDLMKGDLQLGGSKKTVTVFFSDIRDFTKFSEGHTPEQVVEMLNEYFQIMVKIINANGGVVDKFIGDAIMAVWGAPNAGERDSHNAVRACLEMRQALAELNERRGGRHQVPIKIGMGLHRGEAISGTIGSEERMEYTVIGDTVNQASRIESSTKAFGTDLLLSEGLADHVKEEFIVELGGTVEVKGKSEPLKLFKVRGFYDEDKNPVVVRTPYSDYEAGDADKVKVAG
jgi:adenylate cyclase